MDVESSKHITISYAGFNRPWAVWISHQLRARGLTTELRRWDPQVDVAFEDEFGALLNAAGRILLVLDNWYFRLGPIATGDWERVLRTVVPLHADRFAAVSLATQTVPSAVSLLDPVDLHDLDEQESIRRLLRRLSIEPAQTVRPAPPDAPRFPNEPPEVLEIPRRNRRFTGRDNKLEELRELLTSRNQGDGTATRVVLFGSSGTGKSQIATEYAHRFGNDYDAVWWIDATHRSVARERLAVLAPRLGLLVGERIGERIRAVHEALNSGERYRRWLLIFDGADEVDQLSDLLPERHGHILLTSTTREWGDSADTSVIHVGRFTRLESVAYVRRRAERVTQEEADELADAVQDLPLLLAQTAAWLNANDTPVAEYVAKVRQGALQAAQIRPETEYPLGFTTAWSVTLNTLRADYPDAAGLLHLLAFFAPNEIPVRLLTEARHGDLPQQLAKLVQDPRAWHLALRVLSQYTAVRLDYQQDLAEDPAVEQVRMHRLYHRLLRAELAPDEWRAHSQTACQVLVSGDPRRPSDTRDWERYASLIPHLAPAGALDSPRPAVQETVLNCIEYLRVRGEYRTALRLCGKVLEHWQDLDPYDSALLSLQHKRGSILRQTGRYVEAEQLGRSVVGQLSGQGADDPHLLLAKDGLGSTLLALGQFTQARDLFKDAAERFAGQFGSEAPQTMAARHNLGLAHMLLGRYAVARAIHRDVLQIRQRRLRSRHYLTLLSGVVYARLIRIMGDYSEAASRLEQILRTLRQISDERHPQYIMAEHQLGLSRRRSGNIAEAGMRLAGAARRAGQVFGPQHPETLVMEADHASYLREHGELNVALETASSVAERYGELLGPDHPYAIGTLGNLGLAFNQDGQRETALAHAVVAVEGMTRAVGQEHPWTLGCALNLSAAYSTNGYPEEALQLSADTQERAARVLGTTHPLALSAMVALADDLRAAGRVAEAAKVERRALDQLRQVLGPEHSHTRSALRRVRPYWDFEPQSI
ncbi:hypothetical protein SRB5_38200 [Streptomyces sp. RB5]|uniref:TIR domain-containing protein n=1 Tax=Streptomyces smaragdinus TaxID=2585196 RepID=A0A7K0CJK7_9ACTN|nr:FxSxx-COOH system tetratricopeptide repeat protein [Streptomyces smaragdinus]MQY13670.1 hypothetical protein [Streptomyces smaragdinus]